jgi:uncharacterized membrane protein YfcA
VIPVELGGFGYAVAIAAIFAGSVLQGAVGFGFALVAAPVLFLVDPLLVPGPIILSALVLTCLSAYRDRHAIDYSGIGWGMVGRVPGTLAGAAVLSLIPAEDMAAPLGGLVLVAVAMSASGIRFAPGPRTMVVAGLLSGFMGTSSSIGGPPIAMVYQHGPGDQLRGTLGAFFVIGGLMSLPALWWFGRFGWTELWLGGVLIPGTVAGFALSNRFTPLIDRGYTRPAVLAVATAAGVGVIAQQLW